MSQQSTHTSESARPPAPAARKAGMLLVLTAVLTAVAVVGRVAADADQETLAESIAAIAESSALYGIGGAGRFVSGLTLIAGAWFLLEHVDHPGTSRHAPRPRSVCPVRTVHRRIGRLRGRLGAYSVNTRGGDSGDRDDVRRQVGHGQTWVRRCRTGADRCGQIPVDGRRYPEAHRSRIGAARHRNAAYLGRSRDRNPQAHRPRVLPMAARHVGAMLVTGRVERHFTAMLARSD